MLGRPSFLSDCCPFVWCDFFPVIFSGQAFSLFLSWKIENWFWCVFVFLIVNAQELTSVCLLKNSKRWRCEKQPHAFPWEVCFSSCLIRPFFCCHLFMLSFFFFARCFFNNWLKAAIWMPEPPPRPSSWGTGACPNLAVMTSAGSHGGTFAREFWIEKLKPRRSMRWNNRETRWTETNAATAQTTMCVFESPRQFAQPHHFLVGNISDVDLCKQREGGGVGGWSVDWQSGTKQTHKGALGVVVWVPRELTFPKKGTRWCSHRENMSMSFTITISSWPSSKMASFSTSGETSR